MTKIQSYLAATMTAFTLLAMAVPVTSPTPNNSLLDLPGAIQNVPISPVVMRIGIVTDIIEADTITVQISGSDVLVPAAYQFPQYLPVVGDRVVVYKQDAQWFAISGMSGIVNSQIENPSFEIGTEGAVPDGWTFATTILINGTLNAQSTKTTQAVDGLWSCLFRAVFTASGIVEGELTSSALAVNPGDRVVASLYAKDRTPTGVITNLLPFVDWYDASNALILSEQFTAYLGDNNLNSWTLVRPDQSFGTAYPVATAPPGAVTASLRIVAGFSSTVGATSAAVWIDRVAFRVVA